MSRVTTISYHGDNGSASAMMRSLYWIQPVSDLPQVDFSRTVGSRLWCGHTSTARQRQTSEYLLMTLKKWLPSIQLLMLVACPCVLAVFFVQTPWLRNMLSSAAFTASMPLIVLAFATLSWDMSVLLFSTFEFWFLTAVNLLNTLVFFRLFQDLRFVAIIATSLFYQFTLLADANLRTRLIELRLLVFGAPAMMISVFACVLQVTPDFQPVSSLIFAIDDIDLLINGNFIIAFITSLKTHRNRHLLNRNAPPPLVVQCQMYYPNCQLVKHSRDNVELLRADTKRANNVFIKRKVGRGNNHRNIIEHQQTLHMVPSAIADAVDVSRTLSTLWRFRVSTWHRIILNTVGIVGVGCLIIQYVDSACEIVNFSTPARWSIGLVGSSSTFFFITTYASLCQRDLIILILREIDAWFVAVHLTMVMLCTADMMSWDYRTLPIVSMWLWGIWIELLDAMPPATRRRVGFQRWFLLGINVLLLALHASLLFAMFFADCWRERLRNRVLINFTVRSVRLRLEMFSFLASKIITCLIWLSRFIWRELLRPQDAFKLIKHRVQFLIPGETN